MTDPELADALLRHYESVRSAIRDDVLAAVIDGIMADVQALEGEPMPRLDCVSDN